MIAPYRESGIVLDIGTGDGRFVSAAAKTNRDTFYIGIDANAKPLEKLSTKITRKLAKGGLPNAMFVLAAVEELPDEFAGIASEIYINFPWGSLLQAVANGDPSVISAIQRRLKPNGLLTVTIGIDPIRDRSELDRLGVPEIDIQYLSSMLAEIYCTAGLDLIDCSELSMTEWSRIETSWARKLGGNDGRQGFRLKFVRSAPKETPVKGPVAGQRQDS